MYRWGSGVVGVLLLLTACGGQSASPIEVPLQASEFAYTPATIQGQVGLPLTIQFENAGTLEHDWTVEGLAAENIRSSGAGHEHGGDTKAALHIGAPAGQQAALTFTPTEAGQYEFYCSIEGHREAGMVGTLTIEE